MKKVFLTICLVVIIFSTTGCKSEVQEEETNPFVEFIESLETYDVQLYSGFDYLVLQYYEGEIVHEKQVEQRIVWDPEVKIYTDTKERYIQEFNLDAAFHSLSSVTYYYQSKYGVEQEDGSLVWEAMMMEEYLSSYFLVESFKEEDFLDVEISEDFNRMVLIGELKHTALERIFNVDSELLVSNELIIEIDSKENRLLKYSFTYQSNQTETKLVFEPYSGVANVVLPQQ